MRTLALALLIALTADLALAQQPTAGLVLMVEDEPRPEAERMGVALYGGILAHGPYAERVLVKGREQANTRLARAIVAVASRHQVVDVFIAMHTIERDPAEWRRLIPPAAARKLRLVYSSACYGAQEERAAWEGLGARTVVTHVGTNNPVIALPYVMTRWLAGDPIGPAVHMGWRESTLFVRMALSLPGADFGADDLPVQVLDGSRPVVSGDFNTRVSDGLGRIGTLPPGLVYDRARGGPLGLALRAMAGRFSVSGADAMTILRSIDLPLPVEAERLQLERLDIEQPGTIVLRLREKQTIPLERGFTLVLDREVRLTPGRWDPEQRRTVVGVRGIRVGWGILRATPLAFALEPEPGAREGYRVRFFGTFLAFPILGAVHVGGTDPLDSPIAAPLRAPIETPGVLGALGKVGETAARAGVEVVNGAITRPRR